MNYERIYNQIINRAKARKLTEYKETHHIIPKCLGGTDDKDNLIELTAREHFLCHWLLHNQYPENHKLLFAFHMMSNGVKTAHQNRYTPSSRIVAYVKEQSALRLSALYSGDKSPFYGKKKSAESIAKRQETIMAKKGIDPAFMSRKGPDSWAYGKKLSAETIAKRSAARIAKRQLDPEYGGYGADVMEKRIATRKLKKSLDPMYGPNYITHAGINTRIL